MTDDLSAAVAEYQRRGWVLVPIPAGAKACVTAGWQTRQFDPTDFATAGNVGVILGARSGSLVDADLDCAEALELADFYLPATGAEFGRASRPRSHKLYVAPGAVFETFTEPIDGGGADTLIELRSDGATGGAHLTLLPPSIADGEQRVWRGETIAPAVVKAPELRRALAWLAVGCLVRRYLSPHAAERPGPDLLTLLWEFDHDLGRRACRWLGLPDPDAPQRYPRPRRELSRQDLDLAEIVAGIPNDCGWDDWNRIGLAIYAASGGSEDGRIVFDDFSMRAPSKYQPHAVNERWRNYGRNPPNRTGLGKLAKLAFAAGWRPAKRGRFGDDRAV
jgi:hypothetical protein